MSSVISETLADFEANADKITHSDKRKDRDPILQRWYVFWLMVNWKPCAGAKSLRET